MKALWQKWTESSLIIRILIGLVIGAGLALVVPGLAPIEMLGTLFVSGLKAIAPILVFFLVISALANAKAHGNMGTIICLYLVNTLIAGLLAVVASFLFPSTLALTGAADAASAPTGLGEVVTNLLTNAVSNPIGALASANYLGILLWAVLLGIALRFANDTTKAVMSDVANAVSTVIRWIINLAPFGILGLVYSSVASSGLEIFTTYGHLILVLVAIMLVVALVTNPLLVFIAARVNPYPLVLRCLKDSAVTAFFTRSSAANIPVNLKLCEDLGLDRDTYSVSIPLGATINMSGACITISVMTMAAANTLGIVPDFGSAVLLCVLSAVAACGASGVAGGSLLLIPLACSLFGIAPEISAQVIAIGFIIGVVQDSCETALNSHSDVVFTAAAELRRRRKEGKSLELGTKAA